MIPELPSFLEMATLSDVGDKGPDGSVAVAAAVPRALEFPELKRAAPAIEE
jgi:hypothetical protein